MYTGQNPLNLNALRLYAITLCVCLAVQDDVGILWTPYGYLLLYAKPVVYESSNVEKEEIGGGGEDNSF